MSEGGNVSRVAERKRSVLFDNPRLYDWWGRFKHRWIGAPLARLLPDVRSSFESGIRAVSALAKPPCLDIGGGRGEVAHLLTGMGVRAVVLDQSREQCRLLKEMYPNLAVVRGDARHLPFRDAAFETTLFRAVLHHLEEPGAALLEARRTSHQSLIFDHVRDGRWAIGWAELVWLYLQDDGAHSLTVGQWQSLLRSVGITNVQLAVSKSIQYFLFLRVDWTNSRASG